MAQKVAADGCTGVEQRAADFAERSDAIKRPVLAAEKVRDGLGGKVDHRRAKVECSGVDVLALEGDGFLTALHRFKVESVDAESQKAGVVVTVREYKE